MKQRWKALLELYGRLALGVYVVLCAVSFVACFLLLRAGMHELLPGWMVEKLPATGTSAIGAYALYKVLMLPRVALALVITPVIARWVGRAPAPGAAPEARA